MKKATALFIFIAVAQGYLLADDQNNLNEVQHEEASEATESSDVTEILDAIKGQEFQTPEMKPPSALTVWVRSLFDNNTRFARVVKHCYIWFVKKFNRSTD